MKKIGLVFAGAALSVMVAFGAGAFNHTDRVEKAEAATATRENILLINKWDSYSGDALFYNQVGVYYEGTGITSGTVKCNEIVSGKMGYAVLPKNVTKIKIMRLPNSVELPCSGRPGTVWNETSEQTFKTDANVFTFQNNFTTFSYSGYKTVIPTGTTLMFNTSQMSDWFKDGAKSYVYLFLNGEYFGYNVYNEWHECTRLGTSAYVTYKTTATHVLDGFDLVRLDPSKPVNWDAKWSQTSDIKVDYGFNPFYITKVTDETYSGSKTYNWGYDTNGNETAEFFGKYFLTNVVCDGDGSITTNNWAATKTMYNELTSDVKNIILQKVGVISGSDLETAVYRYDYILFYKHYGYEDYIKRENSTNVTQFANSFVSASYLSSSNSSMTIALVGASLITTLSAAAGFVFLKKKESI